MSEPSAVGAMAPLSLSEHLQNVTEQLAATSQQEIVFQIVLEPALEVLRAIAGALLLVRGNRLEIAATRGHEEHAQTIWQDGALDGHVPAGAALEQRQPFFFEHQGALVQAFPELEERTGTIAPVATAVLPMMLDGQPLGAIILDFKEPHVFTPEERRFLQILAAQCAVALGRTRLSDTFEQRIQERTAALDAFVQFTEAAADTNEAVELVRRATEVLRATLGDVSVVHYDLEDGLWRAKGWSSDVTPEFLTLMRAGLSQDTPRFARAVQLRQPNFVSNWSAPSEGLPPEPQYGAVAAYPYFLEGQPISMLSIGVKGQMQWSDQEQGVIRAVGRSLGLALERGASAQQLQEERIGLDAFAAFTEAVGHETDVVALAQQAVRFLRVRFPECTNGYYVREDTLWKLKVQTNDLDESPELLAALRAGVPLETPVFAAALSTQEPVFVNGWDAVQEKMEGTDTYGTVALYPLSQEGVVQAIFALGLKHQLRWLERDRAVFRAVGRSLNLALERSQVAQQFKVQKEEAERRSQALEAFAELSRDLTGETDRYALVCRAQEIILSLLTPGYALYWEEAENHWTLKSQVGNIGDPALQRLVDEQGLPLDAPALHSTWLTGEPNYQDNYDQGADTPAEMIRHVQAATAFRVELLGMPIGMLAIGLFDQRTWTLMDRAVLETAIYSLGLVLERAQSLAALEQSNQKLQASNEELEAFTYSASHDLRTPVRHVMGFAELAEKALVKGQYEKVGTSLEVVKQGALRMTSLIDGMLLLSRSGRQDLHLQPVDLNVLVTQARRDAVAEFGSHPVRWQIGELPRVMGDHALLQQVMTNLLSNAVKYSSKREVSEVKVWGEETETEWTIRVQDNGVGFPPAYAQRLFGIFQRLHTEKEFKGTGIGLATVRRIVQRHGGQVCAESDGQTGALFSFTLPRPN